MEVCGQIHVSAALPRGKKPVGASNRTLGGSQSRYGRLGREGNLLILVGFEPRIVQTVA